MMSKRKTSIELLRIIACFTVVSLHAAEDLLDISAKNYFDYYIYVLLNNGVSTFWFITGFFVFNSNYKKLLKKTFIKVWLPTFVVSIICVFAYDLYLSITSNSEFQNIFTYLISFVYNALRFRTFAPSCKHFWYIYTYCLLVVFYPVLKAFVDYIDNDTKKQKLFVCISLLVIIINEITLNELADISNHGFSALLMASIEVILGHILYKNKDMFIKNISGLVALVLFLITNLLRSVIYLFLIKKQVVSSLVAPWFSVFSIVGTFLLFICCEKFENKFDNEKLHNFISKIGELTFGIYMFHKIPIKIFSKLGSVKIISNVSSFSRYLLLFVYFIICFFTVLVISFVYNRVVNIIFKKNRQKIVTEES